MTREALEEFADFDIVPTLPRHNPKKALSSANKIACLEGDWFHWRDNASVQPALDMLKAVRGCQYVHRRCNTLGEFEYYLDKLARSPSFQLIYFALHGASGSIGTHSGLIDLTLEDLAGKMGDRFRGRVIHFGACQTLRCGEPRIREFLDRTGVAMVTGYTRKVGWVESTAFEFLYFALWQDKKSPAAFDKALRERYGDFVRALGYKSFM